MAQPVNPAASLDDSMQKRKPERIIYGFIDSFVTPGEDNIQLTYEIDQATVSIGREHHCSIRINNLRVSRHQCNIIQEGKGFGRYQAVLHNLTSRPTTIVANKAVCDQGKVQLLDGCRFKIFDKELRWRQFNPKNPSGQIDHRTPIKVVRLSGNGHITQKKNSSSNRLSHSTSGTPTNARTSQLAKRCSSDPDIKKTLLHKSMRNSFLEKGTSDEGNSSLLGSQYRILEELSECEAGSQEFTTKNASVDLIKFSTPEASSVSPELINFDSSHEATPTVAKFPDEGTNGSPLSQLPDEVSPPPQGYDNVESVELFTQPETNREAEDSSDNFTDVPSRISAGVDAKDVETQFIIAGDQSETQLIRPADHDAQGADDRFAEDLESEMEEFIAQFEPTQTQTQPLNKSTLSQKEFDNIFDDPILEAESTSLYTREKSSNSQEISYLNSSHGSTPTDVKLLDESTSGSLFNQPPDEANTSNQKSKNVEVESVETDKETDDSLQVQPPEPEESDETQNVLDVVESSVFINSTDDEPRQLTTPQEISKGCSSHLDSTMTMLRKSLRNSTKEKPTSDEGNSSLVELQSNILEESLESEAVSPEFTTKDMSTDLFRFHTPETSSNSQEIFECSSQETPSVVKYSNERTNGSPLSQLQDEANTSSQKYSNAEPIEILTQHETDMDDGTEESWLNELPEESNASSHNNDNTGCVELPTKSETDRENQSDNLGEVTTKAPEIEENEAIMPEDIELVILSDSDRDVDSGTEIDALHQMPEEANTLSGENDNVEPVELLTQSDNNDDVEGIEESSLNEMTEEVDILSFRKKDSIESMELLDQSKPNRDEGTEESSLNQMLQEDNTSYEQNDNVMSSEVVTAQSESHSEEDLGTEESSSNQIFEEDSSVQNDNVESMELLAQPKFDRDEGTEESSLAQISEEENTSSLENDNFESIELINQSNPRDEGERTQESSLNQMPEKPNTSSPDRNEGVKSVKLLTQSEGTEQIAQNELPEKRDRMDQPNALVDSTVDEPQQVIAPQNVLKKCSVILERLILKGLTDSEDEDELESESIKTPRVSESAKKPSVSASETSKRRLQKRGVILESAKPVEVEAKKRSTTTKKIAQETSSPRKLRKRDFVDAETWSGEESEETSPRTSKSLKLSKVVRNETVHSKAPRRGVKTRAVTPEPKNKPRGRPKTRSVTPEPEEKPQRGLKSRALTPEPEEKPQRKLKSRALSPEPEEKPQRGLKSKALTPEPHEKPQRKLKSRALTPEPEEKPQRKLKTRAVTPEEPEPDVIPVRRRMSRGGEIDGLSQHAKVIPRITRMRGTKNLQVQAKEISPPVKMGSKRRNKTKAVTPEPSPEPGPSIAAKRGRRGVETEVLDGKKETKAEPNVATARTRTAKNIEVSKVSLTQETNAKTRKPAQGDVEKSGKRILKQNDTDSFPAKKKPKTSPPAAEVMTSPRRLRKRTTRKV